MARLLTFGAEEGKGRGMGDVFSVSGNSPVIKDLADNLAIGPRTGDYYYQVYGNDYFQCPIPSSAAELYFGFGIYVPSFGYVSGNTNVYFPGIDAGINIDALNGTVRWQRGTTIVGSTSALPLNRWNYVECYIKPVNSGSGAITIKVNGTTVYTNAAVQTITNAFSQFTAIKFVGQTYGAQYGYVYFDDIVVNDVSGATNNTWPGQVRLMPMRIKGPGDHAALSRGGVDLGYNNSQVREIFSALAWVEGVNTDDYDLYGIDAPALPAGATISNVVLQLHARAQAGGKSIKPILKSDATASDGAATTLGTSWQVVQQAWALDPQDSAAWTAADLATLQVGVKIG